jgi:hypothetical protein
MEQRSSTREGTTVEAHTHRCLEVLNHYFLDSRSRWNLEASINAHKVMHVLFSMVKASVV